MDNLTPKAIVAALDDHIIGQKDAKRAVAVALRNRWRRQRLGPELRDEVTPKNILMIGPTGCGKTEISRRLAKLAEAPFIKIEATKFTEVGYVGRDVDQIARDLAEEAIRLEKERRREAVLGGFPAAQVAPGEGRFEGFLGRLFCQRHTRLVLMGVVNFPGFRGIPGKNKGNKKRCKKTQKDRKSVV